MNKEHSNFKPIPKRTINNKKRIELRRSSPLTFCSEINSEKDILDIDENKNKEEVNENQNDDNETDMEIMAILTGNDNYLKTHFVYDGDENVLKTTQFFPLM